MESFSSHYIQSGINRIHYIESENRGKEIHFLHANGFASGIYLPFYRHLTGCHIVASDIQGHGDSERRETAPIRDWDVFADNLKDVIEAADVGPVVGIGHSLGGYVSYVAAAMYPELFSRLVLIDPVIFPRKKLFGLGLLRFFGLSDKIKLANRTRKRKQWFESVESAYKWFSSGKGMFYGWDDEFLRSYVAHGFKLEDDMPVLKCNPEIEAQFYESIQMDTWKHAGRIKCPVLVIRGKDSDLFKESSARRLKRKIHDCRLETLPNCGHFVPMQQGRACAELIKGFI